MSGPTKEPRELWDEAKGDPERYAALMVEHGHVVPFECPRCAVTKRHRHDGGTIVWTDIFGHDAARAAAPAGEMPPEAHPGEPHEFRTTCQRCGEAGFLNVALITDAEVVKVGPRAALHREDGAS